jgi:glycosyltransferase involved in cell wall biosynthesis
VTAALDCRGLRIAHLIECDGPGGAERIVVELASTLQAAGAYNVVFVPAKGEGWIAQQLQGSGVTIEHFHIDRPISPPCARFLVNALRQHRIEVAHSHEFSLAVYGAWASWRAGVPHVMTMHGRRYYAQRVQRRLAMRVAVALSGRTVAVSTSLKHALVDDLWLRRSRVCMVINGVRCDPPADITLREELHLSPNDHLLLSIGNLYPVKGHQHLIEAVAHLSRAYPTLHLAIAGRGALADSLAARAASYGIGPRVHLLGLRSDVSALLHAADLFVLPSLAEGLSLALLEAMFARRPIVATDVGETRRTLANGDAGVLVPPGDPDALAGAIDALLRDPQRADVLAGRAAERARARYDITHMARRYLRIYRALLRRHNGTAGVLRGPARNASASQPDVYAPIFKH